MTLKHLINRDLLTFDAICEKIRKGEHFSLARYGDGEFKAILGEQGANCDGHEYFPEMGRELADTLRSNPDYYIGLHSTGRNGLDVKTLDWLQENDLTGREYIPNEVFHIPLRDGLMGQFWEALESKQVVTIGPEYIRTQKVISRWRTFHLPIQAKNTYLDRWKIYEDLKDFDLTNSVVLICASMTAPLIVDYL
jgi:hypothetical protein